MFKRLIAVATMTLVAVAAPAAAQQYPPAVNSLTVSDTTPSPGQTIDIEAQTFATGSTVTVSLLSDPVVLGTATAGDNGVIALSATIPTDTSLGAHTLTAVGQAPDGTELALSLALEVVPADGSGAAGGEGASGSLPRTGDDSSIPLARLGLGLAAIGGIALAVAARRRKAAAVTAGV